MNKSMLRQYILVPEAMPADLVPLITSHSPLAYRHFRGDEIEEAWFASKRQRTAVCKVTAAQFEEAKTYGRFFALKLHKKEELGEVALWFEVREEYPEFFTDLPLWKF